MAPKISLGYWKIRGLAQPVRFLLEYVGADYENVTYEQGDGPEFSAKAWLDVKYTLGLPFPNLPYLIDGDIKLTQSNAILRYVANKYNLFGKTEKVRAETDMMLENAMDFRNGLARTVYNKDYANIIDDYFKNVQPTLAGFEKFLEGRKWFGGGDEPTVCDFPMYELLDQHRMMRPDSLKEYKNLQAFLKRFEELPKIKEYLHSDRFVKHPVNNKSAGWK